MHLVTNETRSAEPHARLISKSRVSQYMFLWFPKSWIVSTLNLNKAIGLDQVSHSPVHSGSAQLCTPAKLSQTRPWLSIVNRWCSLHSAYNSAQKEKKNNFKIDNIGTWPALPGLKYAVYDSRVRVLSMLHNVGYEWRKKVFNIVLIVAFQYKLSKWANDMQAIPKMKYW